MYSNREKEREYICGHGKRQKLNEDEKIISECIILPPVQGEAVSIVTNPSPALSRPLRTFANSYNCVEPAVVLL